VAGRGGPAGCLLSATGRASSERPVARPLQPSSL
jgi:hypothetical protein